MPIDFYYTPASFNCRAVQLTAKSIGVDLNLKITHTGNKDHLTPEFIQLNPQHCLPTINDNGFCLWESRAISIYLISKYAENDSLYPKNDLQKCAIIDQRLYFDLGTLVLKLGEFFYPQIRQNQPMDLEKKRKCEDALDMLNILLDGEHKYSVGNSLTLADIVLVTTVSTYDLLRFDLSKYSNVSKWYKLCKETIPGYQEINVAGIEVFKRWLDNANYFSEK